MTTGPGDEPPPGRAEPTFADVMNGFSFDSGRKPKRRLWGRRRDDEAAPNAADTPRPSEVTDPGRSVARHEAAAEIEDDPGPNGFGSTSVRPYAWTRGRTRSGYALEIETLVSTSTRGREQVALLQVEHRAVAELCEQARSVAEVAALLRVPLGVAKVLVGDMAGLGLVAVHQSVSANGDVPDLSLMERVLSGLRRL
ncbi:MAG: DUF742 domain-containing protein [Pseudonocardia sp.]|jgi:hypothetical protein